MALSSPWSFLCSSLNSHRSLSVFQGLTLEWQRRPGLVPTGTFWALGCIQLCPLPALLCGWIQGLSAPSLCCKSSPALTGDISCAVDYFSLGLTAAESVVFLLSANHQPLLVHSAILPRLPGGLCAPKPSALLQGVCAARPAHLKEPLLPCFSP